MKLICRGIALFLFLAIAAELDAHGPSLEVDKITAAPGEEIIIRGEGITANGEIRLTLQGVVEDHSLGHARGGEHGRFETTVSLPSTLKPGNYTLLAAGDEKATVRLTIQGSVPNAGSEETAPTEHAGHEHESGEAAVPFPRTEPSQANSGAMSIERSTRGASRALAWALSLVSGLVGLSLLVRERRR